MCEILYYRMAELDILRPAETEKEINPREDGANLGGLCHVVAADAAAAAAAAATAMMKMVMVMMKMIMMILLTYIIQ